LGWNLTPQEQFTHINLRSSEVPQLAKISVEASGEFLKGTEAFFHEYKDVFTWSYQDMKGIPPSICEHWIDLEEGATLPISIDIG
jgi:hypothetical protein